MLVHTCVALAGLRLAGEPEGIDPEAALEAARACVAASCADGRRVHVEGCRSRL